MKKFFGAIALFALTFIPANAQQRVPEVGDVVKVSQAFLCDIGYLDSVFSLMENDFEAGMKLFRTYANNTPNGVQVGENVCGVVPYGVAVEVGIVRIGETVYEFRVPENPEVQSVIIVEVRYTHPTGKIVRGEITFDAVIFQNARGKDI